MHRVQLYDVSQNFNRITGVALPQLSISRQFGPVPTVSVLVREFTVFAFNRWREALWGQNLLYSRRMEWFHFHNEIKAMFFILSSRNTGMGTSSGAGRIGSFSSSYIVWLVSNSPLAVWSFNLMVLPRHFVTRVTPSVTQCDVLRWKRSLWWAKLSDPILTFYHPYSNINFSLKSTKIVGIRNCLLCCFRLTLLLLTDSNSSCLALWHHGCCRIHSGRAVYLTSGD